MKRNIEQKNEEVLKKIIRSLCQNMKYVVVICFLPIVRAIVFAVVNGVATALFPSFSADTKPSAVEYNVLL